jgi:hypothetical protein
MVLIRIPQIVTEVILQGRVPKGEVYHLQDIMLRRVIPAQILTEAREAILFLREAVIPQVPIVALLQGAADLHHRIVAVLHQVVLTLQDRPPQALPLGLHQAVVDPHQGEVVLLQDSDSYK